jgi:hypothetical protein
MILKQHLLFEEVWNNLLLNSIENKINILSVIFISIPPANRKGKKGKYFLYSLWNRKTSYLYWAYWLYEGKD